MLRRSTRRAGSLFVLLMLSVVVRADNTAQALPFSQDWTNAALITVSDSWSGVPGIIGYRGDNLTALTGADPQSILLPGSNTGDTYSYGVGRRPRERRPRRPPERHARSPSLAPASPTTREATISSAWASPTRGRSGGSARLARTDRHRLPYSTDATSLTTGTWTDVARARLHDPGHGHDRRQGRQRGRRATAVTVGGPGPRASADGATFWIRWTDVNASGADDGLGIDDFSLTPNPAPALPDALGHRRDRRGGRLRDDDVQLHRQPVGTRAGAGA